MELLKKIKSQQYKVGGDFFLQCLIWFYFAQFSKNEVNFEECESLLKFQKIIEDFNKKFPLIA